MMMRRFDSRAEQLDQMQISSNASIPAVQQLKSNTGTLQRQLISKPSLMQKLCDEASSNSISAQQAATSFEHSSPCRCHRLEPRHTMWKQPFSFRYVEISEHHEHCPFHIKSRKKRRLQLKLSYFSMLVAHSLRVMIDLKSGAGGNSIATTIDWIPVVSHMYCPAFRLLSSLIGFTETPKQDHLREIPGKMMQLFEQRKAHPKEVNHDGYSLLQYAIFTVRSLYYIRHSGLYSTSLPIRISAGLNHTMALPGGSCILPHNV
ncbi:uncharacterized protein PV07_04890 [Cladophialophora immunda]|uniref:Uncharacterized protein n=1 Tax=Cladophialophora immunda TaxID=569365 RepID=A0A0D2CZT7_9EURO|nr:uncharacterized protein PV07_04890 [Cladophialophora immunda]KIW29044.1 hypothetical protein PV07_04890 [Cladophialophora immunda]